MEPYNTLSKIVDRCYMTQYEDVPVDVVKFANSIFHLALEADTDKDYFNAKTQKQENLEEVSPREETQKKNEETAVTDKQVEAVCFNMEEEGWLMQGWADRDNIYGDPGGQGTRLIVRQFLEVAEKAK